jgi:hypothetical protein
LIPSGVISNAHGANQGDGKTDDREQDDQPNEPVGDIEKGEDLRRDLDEQPGHDDIGNCDAVNTAPLQLGQKGTEIHGFASTSF